MVVSYDQVHEESAYERKLQGHQNVGELRQMTQVTKINILRLQGHQNVGELRLCEEHEVISSMIAGSPECW